MCISSALLWIVQHFLHARRAAQLLAIDAHMASRRMAAQPIASIQKAASQRAGKPSNYRRRYTYINSLEGVAKRPDLSSLAWHGAVEENIVIASRKDEKSPHHAQLGLCGDISDKYVVGRDDSVIAHTLRNNSAIHTRAGHSNLLAATCESVLR